MSRASFCALYSTFVLIEKVCSFHSAGDMSLVMQYFLTIQVPGEPQASRAKPVSTKMSSSTGACHSWCMFLGGWGGGGPLGWARVDNFFGV